MDKGFKTTFFFLILITTAFHSHTAAQEKNWTHFRGTGRNAISEATDIPLIWDQSAIKWKTVIHDKGYSSPVVYGDQVWLTTATADGKELYAVCVDFNSGRIIHDIKVFSPPEVQGKHSLNTYATPTPCIEKGFVYVHFGSMGTACINTSDGKIVWKQTGLKCNHVQGPASSPILYKNLLILHFDGTDERFIAAIDKTSGKVVWKTDRPVEPYKSLTSIGRKAYVTPIIVTVNGKDLLVSNGSAVCSAYDPMTGKEIWSVTGGGESTIAMPFTENGIVYWYAGYMSDGSGKKYSEMFAVNPDGSGDITASNVIWSRKDDLSQNQMLTPVIKDGLIYTVTTMNIMMCIDAATGKDVWSQRFTSNFNASPVYNNGLVWFFSVKGDVVAIKAGRNYEEVSRNLMDSGIWATPAFLRNSVVLRTQGYLYRIAN